MKIIITGGAGFIGSNLANRLIKQGNEVIIIDNLHTGSVDNINPKADFIKDNAGNIDKHKDELKDIEAIYHIGIYSSSPMYVDKVYLVAEAIKEHIKILEFVKRKKIPIVFASTSSLYNGQKPPHKEDMDVLITDFYTEARYEMERLSKLYSKLYNLNIIGLRLFSVYGKGEKSKDKYANLISQFLWALKKGKKPLVYGDGTQKRDFTYVEDIVDAFILSMKYLEGKKRICQMINAGTGKSYSINEMIKILNKKLGTEIEAEYLIPNPIKNYVMITLADTQKAEKIIGFKAKYNLEDGIDELLK